MSSINLGKILGASDAEKVSILETIEDEAVRYKIIQSIKNDDRRIECLKYLEKKWLKIEAILKIQSDDKRNKVLGEINERLGRAGELIEGFEDEDTTEYKYNKLNLPTDMKFGIEIETEGEEGVLIPDFIGNWVVKEDETLNQDGIECTSPVMNDNPQFISQIYRINEILQLFDMSVSQRCGGHIHIGADYIQNEAGFKELVELFGNAEEVYYLISNKPNELPREGVWQYASPISKTIENSDFEITDDFVEDINDVFERSRHKSLNFMNVNNGKNTIEFRLSNGILDANTWIENIRLYGRTVELASKLRNNFRKERKWN